MDVFHVSFFSKYPQKCQSCRQKSVNSYEEKECKKEQKNKEETHNNIWINEHTNVNDKILKYNGKKKNCKKKQNNQIRD